MTSEEMTKSQAVTRTFVFLKAFGRREAAKRRGMFRRRWLDASPSMEENAPSNRPLSPKEQAKKESLDVEMFESRLVFDMSM
ncbi:MAG: hypothetical protein HQL51_06985 [Magnetococcales bacterium]|nr:hypothetical protein [Magnetococcales bacterium]